MTKRNAEAFQVDSLINDKRPGAFKPWDDWAGMNFNCPCGCGSLLGVAFAEGGWIWDGNRERPTVEPSILHRTPGGCGWHGYLRAGVFEEC